FFADPLLCLVYEITSAGTLKIAAGNGVAGFSGDNGPATSAKLNHPVPVAVDAAGNLLIADQVNQVIRKVSPAGIVTSLARTHVTAGYTADGGAAKSAQLNDPVGVAVDASGNVYIADSLNNVVREVSTAGTITPFAGTGTADYTGDGKQATSATLAFP